MRSPAVFVQFAGAIVAAGIVLASCAGPTQQQLAETPTAKTRPVPGTAPPASSSDDERAQLVQQMDDMEATQRAHAEASDGSSTRQSTSVGAVPSGTTPSTTPPPPKKRGPAEPAPRR